MCVRVYNNNEFHCFNDFEGTANWRKKHSTRDHKLYNVRLLEVTALYTLHM